METFLGSQPLQDVVDRVLVLGDPATFTSSVTDPAIYRDPMLSTELLRRKRVFGVEDDPRFGMKALQATQQVRYFQRR
jgi:hypothetical protein